jgi:hypothetical protein
MFSFYLLDFLTEVVVCQTTVVFRITSTLLPSVRGFILFWSDFADI